MHPEPGTPMAALMALRELSDAIEQMNFGMRDDMGLISTDMGALRMLAIAEARGVTVTPTAIARRLGISTASATKLVDRLVSAGHSERRKDPVDRRSVIVELTEHARREFQQRMGRQMAALRAVAETYSAQELEIAVQFMSDISLAMKDHASSREPTTR